MKKPLLSRGRFYFFYTFIILLICTGIADGADYLTRLKDGNLRFVNNTPIQTKLTLQERQKLAAGQNPFVTIVACSDSRVAPEIIFDQGPGNLFVIRLAGNTVDDFALASIEYGISYLNTPLLIVLGHENCGAVEAAFDLKNSSFSPELTTLLKSIEPAVDKAIKENPGKPHTELVDIAIKLNAQQTLNEILTKIPAVQNLAKTGKLQLNIGVFQLETGKVLWGQPR